MFWIEVKHEGLHKYRMIRGRDEHEVEEKASAQQEEWNAKWNTYLKMEEAEGHKVARQKLYQKRSAEAQRRTVAAETELDLLNHLLADALRKSPIPEFDKLRNRDRFEREEFGKARPEILQLKEFQLRVLPKPPEEPRIPEMPSEDSEKYVPVFTFLDKLSKSHKARTVEAAKELYQVDLRSWTADKSAILLKHKRDLAEWEERKARIDEANDKTKTAFEYKCAEINKAYEAKRIVWEQEKNEFELEQTKKQEQFAARQKEYNDRLKRIERGYVRGTAEGIREYCRFVLAQSAYPKYFPREFEIDFCTETRLLLVEYVFPTIEKLPVLCEVSYKKTLDEFKETFLSDSALNVLYDRVLYQITLRTLYELFKADSAKAMGSIVFNGWVRAFNKATGKKANTCILSIHTTRDSFKEVDLKKVDPKACFRLLKGVGSSELYGLVAIAPIMRIDKTDKRFVEAYGVADELDNSVNIAAMDWEDFEHLVRELFEKEFTQYGGEVKITQASRDGGVDAVAFDPDPIRGGKIVIQAKRYTNVVGVSAVRDLYGTVVNEGAIKGILVTTAVYGPDAYEFAKDKPLTLLNGSNLLHMLERHGHKARIDLNEAKRVLAQENRR